MFTFNSTLLTSFGHSRFLVVHMFSREHKCKLCQTRKTKTTRPRGENVQRLTSLPGFMSLDTDIIVIEKSISKVRPILDE